MTKFELVIMEDEGGNIEFRVDRRSKNSTPREVVLLDYVHVAVQDALEEAGDKMVERGLMESIAMQTGPSR